MARSMVSIGTDESLALAYMVRKPALALISLPPSRAATSTCRMILAKTLARAESCAPLRYLVVAHFECPDIASYIPDVPTRMGMVGQRRQHLDVGGHGFHHRCSDEYSMDRRSLDAGDVEVTLEGRHLPAIPIAAEGDIDDTEAPLVWTTVEHGLGQQNHSGAGSKDGQPIGEGGGQGVEKP